MSEWEEAIREWWRAMKVHARAFGQCPSSDRRAHCPPSLVHGVLTKGEAEKVIAATENAAQVLGGYSRRRHVNYPTTDLPLRSIFPHSSEEVREIIERAAAHLISDIKDRCDFDDMHLIDGFVIKYSADGQTNLQAHADNGRASGTVTLTSSHHTGIYWPSEARYTDSFYTQRLCKPECRGDSCDAWIAQGYSRPDLQHVWGCDCSLCFGEGNTTQIHDDYAFDGGGTVFPTLRNLTFLPQLGDAITHGAQLKHGARPVTNGTRYVLAFFNNVPICQEADLVLNTGLTTLAVVAVIPVFIYIIFFAKFDEEVAAVKKKHNEKPKKKTH